MQIVKKKKEMSYFMQLKIWIGLVLEWSDYALAIAPKIRKTTFGIAEEKGFLNSFGQDGGQK